MNAERSMRRTGSRLFDLVSQLLPHDDREAVQGDLLENGEGWWPSLLAVLGLAMRREATLGTHWRPWLATLGLALPSSLLLIGFSLSVSHAYEQSVTSAVVHITGLNVGPGFALLLCNLLLLAAWFWARGFLVGPVSRRTARLSATLWFAPCAFCLERFRVESLSRLCLLLFLPAALWAARRGLQIARIQRSSAVAFAVGVTALTIPTWGSSGAWIPNWALSWPAWYLVATAGKNLRG
jgi:hypothetical protein